jgi:hypothetical protein
MNEQVLKLNYTRRHPVAGQRAVREPYPWPGAAFLAFWLWGRLGDKVSS